MTISPVSAAVAGALISGVAMYAVGPRAERVDAFMPQPTAYVETVDGQIIPVTPTAPAAGVAALAARCAVVPVAQSSGRCRRGRSIGRSAPAQERVVVQRERSGRSWTKTAHGHRRICGRRCRRRRPGRGQEGRADWRGARRRRCLDIRGQQAVAGSQLSVRLRRGPTQPRLFLFVLVGRRAKAYGPRLVRESG